MHVCDMCKSEFTEKEKIARVVFVQSDNEKIKLFNISSHPKIELCSSCCAVIKDIIKGNLKLKGDS